MTDTDLFARERLPEDLRFLLAKYPRETWHGEHTIGGMGQFWLQRHDMFRELGGALAGSAGRLKEGAMAPHDFAQWFAPRLNFFLQQLDSHHNIEDHHYFPAFSAAEPKLKRGFDILDNDHHLIHDLLEANAAAANDFLSALSAGGDRLRFAVDGYAGEAERLLSGLLRHLDDEEDLIIPLLLDRGETELGV